MFMNPGKFWLGGAHEELVLPLTVQPGLLPPLPIRAVVPPTAQEKTGGIWNVSPTRNGTPISFSALYS
jgi:hypothetical protein